MPDIISAATERVGVQSWTGITELVAGRATQRYEFSPAEGKSVRRFKVPYASVITFCRQMVGEPYLLPDGSLRRHLPQTDYSWQTPDDGYLLGFDSPLTATHVAVAPFSGGGAQDTDFTKPMAKFDYYTVDVTFESVGYEVMTHDAILAAAIDPPELGRYVIRSTESGGRFLVPERGAWLFKTPAEPDPTKWPRAGDKIGIWEGEQTISYRWLDVPKTGWNEAFCQSCCGKTNEFAFDGLAPQTLILMSANKTQRKSMNNARLQQVTFVMLYKPTGVNNKLHPSISLGYVEIVSQSDTTKNPIQKVDFTNLFTP